MTRVVDLSAEFVPFHRAPFGRSVRMSLKIEETVHAPAAFSPFIRRKGGLRLRDGG